MAKTGAERTRDCQRKKRSAARRIGLCITCCKERPAKSGTRTCGSCSAAAAERKKNKRKRDRSIADLQDIAGALERRGDLAVEHNLYEDAVQYYTDALKLDVIAQEKRTDIWEKLARTLSLSGNPEEAGRLYEGLLSSYLSKPGETTKAIHVLIAQAHQLGLDSRAADGLPLIGIAVKMADQSADPEMRRITYLRMAGRLCALNRFEEAESYLDSLSDIRDYDEAQRVSYFRARAAIAASKGDSAKTLSSLRQAIDAAQRDADAHRVASTWALHGALSTMLGDVETAKSSYERALLIARQFHLNFYIPWVCLEYASLLLRMGHHAAAHEYLLSALSYDTRVATLNTLLVEIGIPIALHQKDEKALEQCALDEAVSLAFRSGVPDQIVPVVASFAEWLVRCDRKEEARELLHRAIAPFENAVHIWDFSLAVARHGVFGDLAVVRRCLTRRAEGASSRVAQACLELFEAFVARRLRKGELRRHALLAAQKFGDLGWNRYSDAARGLLRESGRPPVATASAPFADMRSELTLREREIAELVLRGLTSRDIASRLNISRHTVDSHIGSIMNRLGIRSRYELSHVLSDHP